MKRRIAILLGLLVLGGWQGIRAETDDEVEAHKLVLDLAGAFAIPDLDREIKWHCKYARQNGIHVSPTFMVDGLVRADMSSGDSVADWVARLPA